jgi:hypothetical protein
MPVPTENRCPRLPRRIRRQDPLLLMATLIVGKTQVLTIRNLWLCLGSEAMIELMNDLRELPAATHASNGSGSPSSK